LPKQNQTKSNLLNNKGLENLLQVAKTYENDKSNRHCMYTQFTANVKTVWT